MEIFREDTLLAIALEIVPSSKLRTPPVTKAGRNSAQTPSSHKTLLCFI